MRNVNKVREAVGVFQSMEKLREAVNELETKGFPRDAISMLGNKKEVEEKFGRPEVEPEIAENNPRAPRQPPIRKEEKAIGTGVIIGISTFIPAVVVMLATAPPVNIPAVTLAALMGAGVGLVIQKLLDKYFSSHIKKQIKKGGIVLWVRAGEAKRTTRAQEILRKHGAKYIHVSDTP